MASGFAPDPESPNVQGVAVTAPPPNNEHTMSTRPITIGSRNIAYKTRFAQGVGRCTDIYTTRTGDWLTIKDSTTGAEVKTKRGQTQRVAKDTQG